MSTIYDVATLAGVSPATVSRVFNGGSVSVEVERKVRAAAVNLNYFANRTARSLRRQRSDVLALVIPDIENPFFTSLARGVEDIAQVAGYSVILGNSDERYNKERKYVEIAASDNVAGMILAPAAQHFDSNPLTKKDIPIVVVDRSLQRSDLDIVLFDSVAGGRAATRALFDQGFKTVACIAGLRDIDNSRERAAGWREVFTRYCPGVDPDYYLRFANSRLEGGQMAMQELMNLPRPPDAVFTANNMMAMGALQELLTRKNQPNRDRLGISALGDLSFPTLKWLGVTVLPLPGRNLGETAAKLLLARIAGDKQPPQKIVIPIQADPA